MKPGHGTDARYRSHACRCKPCADAHARACKAWRLRTKYGRTDDGGRASAIPMRVPVDQAADHLAALRADGMPWADIADAAGLHRVHLGQIMRRRFPRIHSAVAASILAVVPLPAPDPDYIDPVLVDRAVDELHQGVTTTWRALTPDGKRQVGAILARRGWTASTLTRAAGVNGTHAREYLGHRAA